MHYFLADLVADIVQNGAESGADLLEIFVSESPDSFSFTVRDNGKGMTAEELLKARDPFASDGVKHPHREVGLGIPFLIQTAESTGGKWNMESQSSEGPAGLGASGTELTAWFDLNNVDTPPVGDIPGLFRTALLFQGPGEVLIKRLRETEGLDLDYELRKTELAAALGDLEDARSLALMDRYLCSLED